MKAWDQLLANSSLPGGTAWQLLTNPKATGTGVVISDGYTVELADNPFEVEVVAMEIEVEVNLVELLIEIEDQGIEVEVSTDSIEVEIQQ